MPIINSEKCLACPNKKECSGPELNRLNYKIIKCPFNVSDVKEKIKQLELELKFNR